MSWSFAHEGTPAEVSNQVKLYEAQHDNKAQQFGHVGATKDALLKVLETLPETAVVRASCGGHTDSEDAYSTWCNYTSGVGYAPRQAP